MFTSFSAFVAPLLSEATGAFRAATGVAAAPQRGANPSFATECLGGGSAQKKKRPSPFAGS